MKTRDLEPGEVKKLYHLVRTKAILNPQLHEGMVVSFGITLYHIIDDGRTEPQVWYTAIDWNSLEPVNFDDLYFSKERKDVVEYVINNL